MRRALPLLILASLTTLPSACSGGPPSRPSPPLATSATALPAGAYVWDLRDDSPVFAVTNGAGESEIRSLEGLVAPPVPGHERELFRAVRGLPGGDLWACFETGVASYLGGVWSYIALTETGAEGSCSSLDATSADNLYVGVGNSVCSYDRVAWDCYDFPAPTREVTLTSGHLWFVRASPAHDDLMVIDTITRATPSLVRLGPAGTTGSVLPVPSAEEVAVMHWADAEGERAARFIDVDGNIREQDAEYIVPVGPSEHYLVSVDTSGESRCTGGLLGMCGAGSVWSQAVYHRVRGGVATEVGHLEGNAVGVPSWAFLDGSMLRVPTDPLRYLP